MLVVKIFWKFSLRKEYYYLTRWSQRSFFLSLGRNFVINRVCFCSYLLTFELFWWGILDPVVFVRTSLRSVHTATTSGLYSPERPSCSISIKEITNILLEHFHPVRTSSSPVEKPPSACCLINSLSWCPCLCEINWEGRVLCPFQPSASLML